MKKLVSAIVVLVFISLSTFAEVVKIPVGSQAAGKKEVSIPARGASKAQVESQYGEPDTRHAPVGIPPISTWDYDHYTVYFEHDKVIHSVLKR